MVINCNDLRRCSPLTIDCIGSTHVSSLSSCLGSGSSSLAVVGSGISGGAGRRAGAGGGGSGAHAVDKRITSTFSASSSGAEHQHHQHESIRSNVYLSMEQRSFDAICLHGATDADVIDFASRVSAAFMKKITWACLRSSAVTDKGLEIFLASMNQSLLRLELTGEAFIIAPSLPLPLSLHLFSFYRIFPTSPIALSLFVPSILCFAEKRVNE